MDVELLIAPDCPHRGAAEDVLRSALTDIGLPARFEIVVVAEDRARRRFAGSPTFQVDGMDLFPTRGEPGGSSCRIYRSATGAGGIPDVRALRQALKRAAHEAQSAAAGGAIP